MNRPMRDFGGSGRDGGTHIIKAVVLIAVLVIVGVLVLSRSSPSHKAAAASTTVAHPRSTGATTVPAPTTTTTLVAPAQIKVQVLNGLLTGSLASEWNTKLKTKYGYATQLPDNTTAKVATSAIYILSPGYVPEALALAAQVGLPASAVNTTIPAPASAPIPASERASANLVLVIGPDLAATA